jgi:hypothetical protein
MFDSYRDGPTYVISFTLRVEPNSSSSLVVERIALLIVLLRLLSV